jgi:hypothetical protein
MSAWVDRTSEEARLFNPSFLGLLVWSATAGYMQATRMGLPFELVFVALPLSLHKPTRDALPRNQRTSLPAWLDENSHLRVGFVERTKGLLPFVREAVLFGAHHGLITISDGGRLEPSPRPRTLTRYTSEVTEDVRDCLRRAEFLGRWFGTAGTSATIMALWGIAP